MKKVLLTTLAAAALLAVSPVAALTDITAESNKDPRVQAAKGTPQEQEVFQEVYQEINNKVVREKYGEELDRITENGQNGLEDYYQDMVDAIEAEGGVLPEEGTTDFTLDPVRANHSVEEAKSTEEAVKDAKAAAKPAAKPAQAAAKPAAKAGQKVLPNTSAVK